MSHPANLATWLQVAHALRVQPPGTVLRLPKWQYPHPVDSGAHVSIGLPLGQSADFRWRLPGCAGLHVRDFGSHFEAHVDSVDPGCDPVEHLRQDAPEAFVAGAAAIGALVGAVLGRSREATLAGAGIGAIFGFAVLPAEVRADAARETANIARKIFDQQPKPCSRARQTKSRRKGVGD
jgi:hypothetical protein